MRIFIFNDIGSPEKGLGFSPKKGLGVNPKNKMFSWFLCFASQKILLFLPLMLLFCNLLYECVQFEIYSETDEQWQTTHYL